MESEKENAISRLSVLLDAFDQQRFGRKDLFEIVAKFSLYAKAFFQDEKYSKAIEALDPRTDNSDWDFQDRTEHIRSLIVEALEELRLSVENSKFLFDSQDKKRELEWNEIRAKAEEIEKLRESLIKEREEILTEQSKFNEFKQKLEISDKKIDFNFIAEKNLRISRVWLTVSAIAFFSILYYALWIAKHGDQNFKTVADAINSLNNAPDLKSWLIKFALLKTVAVHAIILSMLIFGLIFCAKNYNSRMHNYVINLHKANALTSTVSLLNTAKSDDGNDQLLVQACQAIFSHQKSGFSGKDGEIQSPNIISNFFDKAAK